MYGPVLPKVFGAVSVVDVDTILGCSDQELRPVLSCLVRMSLIAPMDQSPACLLGRTAVLQVLSRIELVNSIVALLSIDFHSLELDVKKEQQLKQKLGANHGESILISNITSGPALEFERSDPTRKLRLVLSELMTIMAKERREDGQSATEKIVIKQSELFDHRVYLNEVCDVLAIALAELPALLQPKDVSEALLSVKYGPEIICHIVANQADCFLDVAFHLLEGGEKQDEEEEEENVRQEALLLLARMCPTHALTIRARCVDQYRMPGLSILLSLEHGAGLGSELDVVEYMTGLLLGGCQQTRAWMSHYIRNAQRRKCQALTLLRQELTRRLAHIRSQCSESNLGSGLVAETSYLLRLFSALRGIAGLKFVDEETALLLEVITQHPPPSPAGVKLVSLGLSMLISCNSLISTPALEKQATDWIRWLVKEEAYFESASGCTASFGEMLLLIAINFHAGQLGAIVDLVCQTLGMKMAVKTNTMTRMKQIFINDIFPESTVAAHAVKVPVTRNLSAELHGFLPVHCMHQLLKSRVFSKHKVSIKSWIYRQVCSAASPLHPILPSLIEAYVQSILVPPSHRSVHSDQLNQPLTEQEIRSVFSKVVIDKISEGTPVVAVGSTPNLHSASRRTLSARDSALSLHNKGPQRRERTAEDNLCVQICVLYYILLYEDVRLANMKTILPSGRKVLKYSAELLAELPVKFLLSAAESKQVRLEGMFPSLLRLCATQFPHLCLVEDWIRVDNESGARCGVGGGLSRGFLHTSLCNVSKCPPRTVLALQHILELPPSQAWDLAEAFISIIRDIIKDSVPRQVQELYRSVWMNLNSVYPRKLWLLTVNNLTPKDSVISRNLSQEELSLDPLAVLRCDPAVFRSGPILSIVLYMLKACLAASRTRLSQHLQEQLPAQTGQAGEIEKEELKNALVLTQESAAIQILLECCVPGDREAGRDPGLPGDQRIPGDGTLVGGQSSRLTALQEVQSLVCSYLHEAFIADPNLAKLVHFQGYPTELLPVTVLGVPSMHICLDFAPELLSQPSTEKQVFAIDLISHLSVQYSLPKSLSTARLSVNTVSTLLSVLSASSREDLVLAILPAMERVCEAFPPLTEDVISLLLQAGRMFLNTATLGGYASPSSVGGYASPSSVGGYASPSSYDISEFEKNKDVLDLVSRLPTNHPLCGEIMRTFRNILNKTCLEKHIY